jgi:hypothetical protein
MITMLEGFPDHILAVSGVGKVTAEDYRDTLIPEATRRIEKFGKMRLFCVLGDQFEGLTAGAAWADLSLGVSRWNEFDRLAVITDSTWIKDAILLLAPIYRHPMRVFSTAERDAARAWILEED